MKGDTITIQSVRNRMSRQGLIIGALLVTALLLILVAGCSKSGDQTTTNNAALAKPMAVAEQSDSAITALNWAGYAALVYPPDLQRFHDMLMPGIEAHPSPTNADSVNLFGTNFAIDSLRKETPEQFFVTMMDMVVKLSPQLGMTFSSMTNDHIGGVFDGDSLVHVVSRTKMNVGTQNVDEMNVVTTREYEGNWKVILSPKLEGVGMMLQQGLAQPMMPQQRPPQKP